MWNMYSSQTRRLALLHRYKLLITASEHMRREYLRYGFAPAAVRTTMSPIDCGHSSGDESCGRAGDTGEVADNSYAHTYAKHAEIRLLFAGRMERLKGGVLLIDALSQVANALGRPVRLILAGNGTDRRAWAEHARLVCARNPTVEANFIGWLGAAKLEGLAKACDLLVVPSLWPEPFGRVGLEFGLNGLPVAAFAVGGIPEWLTCGVNGYLAPADPPTSFGLAEAIVRCLRDPAEHARLRGGAVEVAKRFCVDRHTAELHDIFSEVAAEAT
jgi:glycosyltransferase involved in cell wall biosynthesis